MLELINVNAYYGRIQALKDVSFRVDEGKIVSLLGANGAGKTTTVRTIVGLNRSTANDIRFEGRPIGRIPPHQIVRLGIAMVPERRELFSDMKVSDNLEMGAYSRANRAQMRRDLESNHGIFEKDWSRFDTKRLVWNHPRSTFRIGFRPGRRNRQIGSTPAQFKEGRLQTARGG